MPLERLDYDKADIWMVAETRIEKELRLKACEKEPETIAWIEEMKPGEVLYDIGANVGSYSLVAGKRGIRVFAFEPFPPNFDHLLQNIKLNQLEEAITLVPYAVGSISKSTWIGWSQDATSGDSPKIEQGGGIKLDFVCLDDLKSLYGMPLANHIKIDVDGSEVDILIGGIKSLKRAATALVEIQEHNLSDALKVLVPTMGNSYQRHKRNAPDTWNYVFGTTVRSPVSA